MSEKGGCCKTCGMCVLTLGVLAGIGVVLWQFVIPEDSKASIQDKFNNTIIDGGGSGGGILPDIDIPGNPLNPQQEGSDSGYSFMQCQAGDGTNRNCCNGLDTICDLRSDEVLYAGVHNAMAATENGFLLAPNHKLSLEKALTAGYRAINIDFADCGTDYGFLLIHGRCNAALGSRDPTEVFTNIVSFLQENPTEVIILNMQIDNEASVQDVDLTSIETVMKGVPGFVGLMYNHPDASTPWPTLRELINANTRILFFHYNGQSCKDVTCPAGFHDWFSYAAETEFSFSSVEEVQDTAASCVINRGKASSSFFGVNSFVTLSSRSASETLNTYDALQGQMEACSELNGGIDVNVVWVDFWAKGDLPRLTQAENQARAEAAARLRKRQRRMLGQPAPRS